MLAHLTIMHSLSWADVDLFDQCPLPNSYDCAAYASLLSETSIVILFIYMNLMLFCQMSSGDMDSIGQIT